MDLGLKGIDASLRQGVRSGVLGSAVRQERFGLPESRAFTAASLRGTMAFAESGRTPDAVSCPLLLGTT
ncbi:MAG: hypothetical protein COY42_22640 [Armatimonadetes bacterium CG_4_10_14_0_8_um_filter_66_14]|nr:MAG: hypothetical protein COY42_22640 [Armatimonadetes bacterium CG_4_10_14_0_8_um_filter_66_14]